MTQSRLPRKAELPASQQFWLRNQVMDQAEVTAHAHTGPVAAQQALKLTVPGRV